MKKSTRTKTQRTSGVSVHSTNSLGPTSHDTPSVVHVQCHLSGEFLRLEILHAKDGMARCVFELLARDVAEFHVIGTGQNRARRPLGEFETVVTQLCGENSTTLHVQFRSPVQPATNLKGEKKAVRLSCGRVPLPCLGIPLVDRFDVDKLIFTVGSDLNAVLFAPDDNHLIVAQIPRTVAVGNRCSLALLVRLNERIRIGKSVAFFVLQIEKTTVCGGSEQEIRSNRFQHLLSEVVIDEHSFHAEILR